MYKYINFCESYWKRTVFKTVLAIYFLERVLWLQLKMLLKLFSLGIQFKFQQLVNAHLHCKMSATTWTKMTFPLVTSPFIPIYLLLSWRMPCTVCLWLRYPAHMKCCNFQGRWIPDTRILGTTGMEQKGEIFFFPSCLESLIACCSCSFASKHVG